VHQDESPSTDTVTAADNTRRVQYAYNIPEGSPGRANDGLVFKEELYDANNNLLHKTMFGWNPDPVVSFDRSPRPDYVEETDERSRVTRTEYTYGFYNSV